jgi:hypothetical protein
MDNHLDSGKLPEEIKVLRRGHLFWPIFTAAIVCSAAVFLTVFAIGKGVVDGWKMFPVVGLAMLFVYIAFSQVVSIWWCSSNYLKFDAEGFRWGRLPLLTWEQIDGVGWIGGAKGVYNLVLSGPGALAWLNQAPLVVRIVTRIAFASVTKRANSLWVPLCADWQTVDPKVVIRASSQFKVNKSGHSTVMPLP